MKKFNFTLTELLTVIAIIAILAGLMFPAVNSARKKARETQARADIQTLKTAIISMKTTYGKMANKKFFDGALKNYRAYNFKSNGVTHHQWTIGGNRWVLKDGGWAINNRKHTEDAYALYMRELMGFNSKINTKGTSFIDIPSDFAGDSSNGKIDRKVMIDPWGNQYIIAFYNYEDSDSAGRKRPRMQMPSFAGGYDSEKKEFFGELFILSKGADGLAKREGDSVGGDNVNKDNIISWKE